jgi:hypothetical protein
VPGSMTELSYRRLALLFPKEVGAIDPWPQSVLQIVSVHSCRPFLPWPRSGPHEFSDLCLHVDALCEEMLEELNVHAVTPRPNASAEASSGRRDRSRS